MDLDRLIKAKYFEIPMSIFNKYIPKLESFSWNKIIIDYIEHLLLEFFVSRDKKK